jgi:hypothetical protein
MSYPSFPDIALPNQAYEETPEDPGISSKMENGSVVSRARFTRSRLTFVLNWSAMSATDKDTLLDFYRNTIKGTASLFTWVHPDPASGFYNVTFKVRITAPPKFTKVSFDRWSTSLTLQED